MGVSPYDADYAGGSLRSLQGRAISPAIRCPLTDAHQERKFTCFNYYSFDGSFTGTAVTTPVFPNQTNDRAELQS